MVNTDKFYSKILLFGEYSVLQGSMALSIPYSHFQGELSFIHEDKYTDLDFARSSNTLLGELHQYLEKNSVKNGISGRLNLEKLESDIRHGVDLIDTSSGGMVTHAKIPLGPGYQVPFAERIKRESGIMTGAVGLITEAQQAEVILQKGQADLILIARQSLRDPNFPLHDI